VKKYLGDAVYYEWDGSHIVLTTENGINKTNEIFINEDVLWALIKMPEVSNAFAELTKEQELRDVCNLPRL